MSGRLSAFIAALFACAVLVPAAAASPVPHFSHVVEVMLENESATSTFEDPAAAPNLAKLRTEGVYLPQFFAAGHASLDNYEAAFGGVEPSTQGKADCLGMPYSSCIFPATVPTLGALLDGAGLSWRIYSEGMVGAPGGGNCLHAPVSSLPDPYQGPLTNGYATRHNPAPWFASVLDKNGSEAYCQAHNVDLAQLWKDAASPSTLPAWSFIQPDTCHDGHDTSSTGGCALDPEGPLAPSGVAAIDAWLPDFVKQLTSSPAWDAGSLLVITFDEGATTDTAGCAPCNDTSAGGRIGMLLIGGVIAAPGTTYAGWQGDHYSLLRTWEAAWGLPSLKSEAASSAAATTVHDGDPGVSPLTGVWGTPSPIVVAGSAHSIALNTSPAPPAGPAGLRPCIPAPIRVYLGRVVSRVRGYIGSREVLSSRGVRSVHIARPPLRTFVLRLVIGHRRTLRFRYTPVRTAGGCGLRRMRST